MAENHVTENTVTPVPQSASKALIVGGLAALLASACCVGPLVLVMVGISGVWIGNLAKLDPYQPLFIATSAVALFFAWRQIWRPAACAPGQVCAAPRVNLAYKLLFGFVVVLLIVAFGFPLIARLLY
jgi:mercuric ion transport protein